MSAPGKGTTDRSGGWNRGELLPLIAELQELMQGMHALEEGCAPYQSAIHPQWRGSVNNLLHYLAMRRRDIRPLQDKLALLGLSSLGRAEKHVLASIASVHKILLSIAGLPPTPPVELPVSFDAGRLLLEEHTERLLGPKPGQRRVRIMVTMPSEAGEDYLLVRELLDAGMDCMRINCAHDGPAVWERMIENLRRAKRELGKKCRILMDLGGPKLRTGTVESGNRVVKWRPRRDPFGRVLEPARIWLAPQGSADPPDEIADAMLSLPEKWLASLRTGDSVEFSDARGASRSLLIVGEAGPCRWAEAVKTAYVTTGTIFHRRRTGKSAKEDGRAGRVGEIIPRDPHILLKRGEMLVLTRAPIPGREAQRDARGKIIHPASIACTLPEVFDSIHPGERIWFDDGKIGGIVRTVTRDQVRVEITHARPQGEKLRGEKGINLPDTKLGLAAMTAQDEENLRFVVKHAHMVGMSFVQDVEDVYRLQRALKELGGEQCGIVLKIETRRGFEMLPDLLLAAMGSQNVGVMIARGDLAVECGYERLAEAQEEILWLCEAAHMPAIWATQVLETLAQSGLPSRAEITDAAMGERAECVMLNKGPHIIDAIRALDNILQRMEAHQNKKSHLLRQLRWWEQAHTHCRLPPTS
ncbi:pyruvate kinase [Geobacter pickeringii]|uniref:pyruvate kinase n=1 Tax=Geobacter pickeringii TaxID=345632 RepID=UPI000A04D527|nr:pyruvate kinase [Geobacter pickeringii]